MLVFTVLATLLCSSLIDARLAPLNTSEALTLCESQNQPSCNNPALEIGPETSFHPKVNAQNDEVSLSLTVKNNEPLSFSVSADAVTWGLKRPGADCSWLVISTQTGPVTFAEKKGDTYLGTAVCNRAVGRDVKIAVSVSRAVEVSGGCNPPVTLQLTCKYAAPDSGTIQDWDIWALSVSASDYSNPTASMTFENAYVVYDEPEPTTTTSSAITPNGAANATASTNNPNGATAEVGLGTTPLYIGIGVCGLIILILIVALIVETIFIVKLKRTVKTIVKTMEKMKKDWVEKATLAKYGWVYREELDQRSRTATVDRYCQDEGISLESKSKRLEDENKLAAAETAQKPAPTEGQPEQKVQPSQEVFNNAAAAGSGNQPAADPQKNA